MKELIRIERKVIGTERVNSIDARALHVKLNIKQQFGNWIDNQIKSLGLEENIDYIVFTKKTDGRPAKEYIITTDTAKHISMASRTQKGKEIRRYFIEFEKQHKEKINPQQVGGYKSQLAQHSKKIAQLQQELKQLRRDIPALEQMGCQRKLELCEAKLREQGVFIPGTLEDLYLVGLGRDYYNNNQEIVNENLKLRKEVRQLRNFKRQISNVCDNT